MVFSLFKSHGQADIYIDLGTINTKMVIRNRGLIINEPSVIAYTTGRHGKKNIVAVGTDAIEQVRKTPGNLFLGRPLREGVIADVETSESMLRFFLSKPGVTGWLSRPNLVISIPHGVKKIEKEAVVHAGKAAGARNVILVEEPMVAAIGADLPIQEPKGQMIIDLGGGTSEIAIIALSDIVFCQTQRIGGQQLNEAIITWMKKYKNALITENIAEDLKIKIGSASILKENESIRVTARDATSGLPMELDISSRQITEAISDCIQDLIFAIRRALENTPPELLSDIIDNGIVITGGGSLLRNIDKVIQDEVRIKVHRTADPLVNIAKGGSILLDNPLLLENIQLSLDEELETVARRSSFY
jgi:rod shape-determining protein MreB